MSRLIMPGTVCLVCAALLFATDRISQAMIYAAYKFSAAGEGHNFATELLGSLWPEYLFLLAGAILIIWGLSSERKKVDHEERSR